MRPRRLRGISRGFPRLSPCGGQVPYVLLTRAPVAGGRVAAPPLPLDLHVLGLSLAFILSQDQTLRCCYALFFFFLCPTRAAFVRRPAGERTLAARGFRAFFIRFVSLYQGIDVDSAEALPPCAAPRSPAALRPRLCHIVS